MIGRSRSSSSRRRRAPRGRVSGRTGFRRIGARIQQCTSAGTMPWLTANGCLMSPVNPSPYPPRPTGRKPREATWTAGPIPGETAGTERSATPVSLAETMLCRLESLMGVLVPMAAWTWRDKCGSGRPVCGADLSPPLLRPQAGSSLENRAQQPPSPVRNGRARRLESDGSR